VTCVAWNPKNNDVLATGSNDGFARLWDLHPPTKTEDSEQERERALVLGSKPTAMSHKGVEASLKNITAVSWHPDGTVLVTGMCPLAHEITSLASSTGQSICH